MAPLSQRHSQSNSEVMQSSMYQPSNRRGSTTGGGGNNYTNNHHNNSLAVHPLNQNNGHHYQSTGNELVLSRRPSAVLSELLSTRRPSALMAALTRPHRQQQQTRLNMMEIREGQVLGSSTRTLNMGGGHHNGPECPEAMDFKRRNRRIGE